MRRALSNPTAWTSVPRLEPPPLDGDLSVDVCIVGAGLSGLSVAYNLVLEGRSVAVLENGVVGGGMTERTTAHLSSAVDDRYFELERHHGEHGARAAAESHTTAIDHIERVVADEEIDCGFERVHGYLFSPPDSPADLLDRELAAARRAGLEHVEVLGSQPLGGKMLDRCLLFPRQAQFHPLKYANGVAAAIGRRGGRIFCGTRAARVEAMKRGASVKTANGHSVSAGAVVVATNTPINDVVSIHTKQAPYSTYVVGLRVPATSGERALYWDTADPYHYARLVPHVRKGYDLLIVGGEDHRSGQAHDGASRLKRLERWAREYFPLAEDLELRWSGQVMEPVDGVAFIGRNPGDDHVYIVTGDSGQGMTHGTIAGLLLTDLVLGRPCPWEKLYDPSRKMIREAVEYAKESANVAARYLKDYAGGGDVASVDEIPRGQGAVLRRGLKRIAVFRDKDGMLHERSAVCPHLGCVVSFDAVEGTWDCPCHGSRFDCFGSFMIGPANRDLARVDGEARGS